MATRFQCIKRLILPLMILSATIVSCNTDKWRLEQNANTLAGSVASPYEYSITGQYDGVDLVGSTNGKGPYLLIKQDGNNKVSFTILGDKGESITPEGIKEITTSSVLLSGDAGDVQFTSEVDIHVDNNSAVKGTASGWLKRIIPTKTTPAQFNLEGVVNIEWKDASASSSHKVSINSFSAL